MLTRIRGTPPKAQNVLSKVASGSCTQTGLARGQETVLGDRCDAGDKLRVPNSQLTAAVARKGLTQGSTVNF